jgi:hypothetical protein
MKSYKYKIGVEYSGGRITNSVGYFILKGNIFVNGRNKSGIFKPEWNKYSNSVCYRYYTYKGHRGEGGFTLSRAYYYFENGTLFLNN